MTTPILISDDASAEDVASIVTEQHKLAGRQGTPEADQAFSRFLAATRRSNAGRAA
jgi:hypothetical protein